MVAATTYFSEFLDKCSADYRKGKKKGEKGDKGKGKEKEQQ
jgi:hypothetical protein